MRLYDPERSVGPRKCDALAMALLLGLTLFGETAAAQVHPAAEFQITRINRNIITAPQFTYSGAEQFAANQRDRWLEVEVEFAAAPEFSDDLTLKYFVLLNGKVLTGEVTHTNVPAGRENRSVMYVSPRSIARCLANRPLTPNLIQNIAVQIVRQGAVKDEMSLVRAAPQWYAALPQLPGFLLNKNQTPFAPLYWDRYEEIKTPAR